MPRLVKVDMISRTQSRCDHLRLLRLRCSNQHTSSCWYLSKGFVYMFTSNLLFKKSEVISNFSSSMSKEAVVLMTASDVLIASSGA